MYKNKFPNIFFLFLYFNSDLISASNSNLLNNEKKKILNSLDKIDYIKTKLDFEDIIVDNSNYTLDIKKKLFFYKPDYILTVNEIKQVEDFFHTYKLFIFHNINNLLEYKLNRYVELKVFYIKNLYKNLFDNIEELFISFRLSNKKNYNYVKNYDKNIIYRKKIFNEINKLLVSIHIKNKDFYNSIKNDFIELKPKIINNFISSNIKLMFVYTKFIDINLSKIQDNFLNIKKTEYLKLRNKIANHISEINSFFIHNKIKSISLNIEKYFNEYDKLIIQFMNIKNSSKANNNDIIFIKNSIIMNYSLINKFIEKYKILLEKYIDDRNI